MTKKTSDTLICIVTGLPGAIPYEIGNASMPLCARVKFYTEQVGLRVLADKYDSVCMWLKKHRWEYSYVSKKWIYYGK